MYTIDICTDGTIINTCLYLLLVAICVVHHWLGIFTSDMHLFEYCVTTKGFVSLIMSL